MSSDRHSVGGSEDVNDSKTDSNPHSAAVSHKGEAPGEASLHERGPADSHQNSSEPSLHDSSVAASTHEHDGEEEPVNGSSFPSLLPSPPHCLSSAALYTAVLPENNTGEDAEQREAEKEGSDNEGEEEEKDDAEEEGEAEEEDSRDSGRRQRERAIRTQPTAAGVSTRRTRARLHDEAGSTDEEAGEGASRSSSSSSARHSESENSSVSLTRHGRSGRSRSASTVVRGVADGPTVPLSPSSASLSADVRRSRRSNSSSAQPAPSAQPPHVATVTATSGAAQPLSFSSPSPTSTTHATVDDRREGGGGDTATQAAISAQEQQLRRTLLSIFPAHLRAMQWESPPTQSSSSLRDPSPLPTVATHSDKGVDAPLPGLERNEEALAMGGSANATAAAAAPAVAVRWAAEPLLPLLEALCEDKAFVHAAWCRYEDDVAVQRAQSSIQRKRQRHSFNKGSSRKAAPLLSRAAGRAAGDGDVSHSDGEEGEDNEEGEQDDDEDEDDVHQPPEPAWVAAPPGLCGRPHLPPSCRPASGAAVGGHGGGINSAASSAHTVVEGGFQWTPWRFYREKRRRGARTKRVVASAADARGGPSLSSASASAPASASCVAAAADTLAKAGNSAVTAQPQHTAMTPPPLSSSVPHSGSVGGVPSLQFSEVPSLPVLQVDVDVPASVTATVEAMTEEEQKSYARYVMSSGKLRNVCREPYSFLVSRAKEMRVQWERQHPFE